jgi:hypothetical protein
MHYTLSHAIGVHHWRQLAPIGGDHFLDGKKNSFFLIPASDRQQRAVLSACMGFAGGGFFGEGAISGARLDLLKRAGRLAPIGANEAPVKALK